MRKLLLLVLMFISGMSYALAQSAVTGTVTDENGEGIPGANIVIKGTSNGTITDIIIVSPETEDLVQFSNQENVQILDAIVVKFSLPFLNLSSLFQPIYLSLTPIDVTSDANDTIPKSFPLFLSLINNFTFRPGLAVQLIV